jgi:hypothetical protein
MSKRIIENLSPEDQARAHECMQQAQFAFVQLAQLFRKGTAGLELTGAEFAATQMLQQMAGMVSSGLYLSGEQMPTEKAVRIAQELMGGEN